MSVRTEGDLPLRKVEPMEIGDFVRTWPYLFHVTAGSNLVAIRSYRRLFTAKRLLRGAGRADLVKLRREAQVIVEFGSFSLIIRGQEPLDPDCLELDEGWTLSDYVQILNSRVFFWPGTETGPIKDGEGMAERQKDRETAILRISTFSLLDSNHHVSPSFSPHNTGAAWCDAGKRSQRGAKSFLLCEHFEGTAADVAEVTFEGTINLPRDTHASLSFSGPWWAIA